MYSNRIFKTPSIHNCNNATLKYCGYCVVKMFQAFLLSSQKHENWFIRNCIYLELELLCQTLNLAIYVLYKYYYSRPYPSVYCLGLIERKKAVLAVELSFCQLETLAFVLVVFRLTYITPDCYNRPLQYCKASSISVCVLKALWKPFYE